MLLQSQRPTSRPLSIINEMFGLTVIFKPRDALIPGTKETEFSLLVSMKAVEPLNIILIMVSEWSTSDLVKSTKLML